MSQPAVTGSAASTSAEQGPARLAAIAGGVLWALVAPVFVLWDQVRPSARTPVLIAAFLVGVVLLLLLTYGLVPLYKLGVPVLGRAGMAGVVISAIALVLMAIGNGTELFTVAARGEESELGHTIFLSRFLCCSSPQSSSAKCSYADDGMRLPELAAGFCWSLCLWGFCCSSSAIWSPPLLILVSGPA